MTPFEMALIKIAFVAGPSVVILIIMCVAIAIDHLRRKQNDQ